MEGEVATIGVVILAAIKGFEVFGKAIPDSATGVLGWVRKIAKIFGLYLNNKS